MSEKATSNQQSFIVGREKDQPWLKLSITTCSSLASQKKLCLLNPILILGHKNQLQITITLLHCILHNAALKTSA